MCEQDSATARAIKCQPAWLMPETPQMQHFHLRASIFQLLALDTGIQHLLASLLHESQSGMKVNL